MHRFARTWAMALPACVALAGPAQPSPKPYRALLAPWFPKDQAGGAVVVMEKGKVLFAQGFGLASRELGVPAAPGQVFRIGSITKQFTAAAVMALVEEGKVALDAPVSRYLADLPESWRPVTVEQLLNHTGGIPSYTDDPGYMARIREDLPGRKLLETTVFAKPLDFAPGTQWRYSNSGYFLLGLLIEQASGKDYAAFLQARFFGPLGLRSFRYGTETEFVPGMASGYTGDGKPALYMSMTHPYSAGALVGTAEDLARWTLALHAGKVVGAESLRRMTAPARTADGKTHPYGFGLGWRDSQGRRLVGHDGRIPGFASQVEADPAAQRVAVILCNTDVPPVGLEFLSRRLLALAAGTPIPEPVPVALPPAKLGRFAGAYQHEGYERLVSFEGGRLYSQAAGGERYELIPTSELTFHLKAADTSLRFEVEGDRVVGVHRRNEGEPEGPLAKWEKREPRKVAAVDPATFEALAGTYLLAPGFELKVWREGERFLTQATGQPVAEMYPEAETRYFLKVVDAVLDFEKGPDGRATQLVLSQGGQKMPAKRVK